GDDTEVGQVRYQHRPAGPHGQLGRRAEQQLADLLGGLVVDVGRVERVRGGLRVDGDRAAPAGSGYLRRRPGRGRIERAVPGTAAWRPAHDAAAAGMAAADKSEHRGQTERNSSTP